MFYGCVCISFYHAATQHAYSRLFLPGVFSDALLPSAYKLLQGVFVPSVRSPSGTTQLSSITNIERCYLVQGTGNGKGLQAAKNDSLVPWSFHLFKSVYAHERVQIQADTRLNSMTSD